MLIKSVIPWVAQQPLLPVEWGACEDDSRFSSLRESGRASFCSTNNDLHFFQVV